LIRNLNIYSENRIKYNKSLISEIIKRLKNDLKFKIESIELNFISSDKMVEINKKYLDHNFPTDIITFNYSDKNDSLDGEIFICRDVAKENASSFGCSTDDEILRLIIHGFLHLLGYNDILDNEKREMKLKEDTYVNKYKGLLPGNSFTL